MSNEANLKLAKAAELLKTKPSDLLAKTESFVSEMKEMRQNVEHLKDKPLDDTLLLPEIMLRDEKDRFLDDTTPQEVSAALNVPVAVVGMSGAELLDALLDRF